MTFQGRYAARLLYDCELVSRLPVRSVLPNSPSRVEVEEIPTKNPNWSNIYGFHGSD